MNAAHTMDMEDVVMKLVGPVRATGDIEEDRRRRENLKHLADLVESLLENMHSVGYDLPDGAAKTNELAREAEQAVRYIYDDITERFEWRWD